MPNLQCPAGTMGSSCQYIFDVLQCVIELPYSQVVQTAAGGQSFSTQFSIDMAAAAEVPNSYVLVQEIDDNGDDASVTVTFALMATSPGKLRSEERYLNEQFSQAESMLMQGQVSSSIGGQGITISNNAGSTTPDINEDTTTNSSGLSIDMIVGIAAGGVALIVAIIIGSICIYRRRKAASTIVQMTAVDSRMDAISVV